MITTHTFWLNAVCPVDEAPDLYEVTIRTYRTIQVEQAVEAAQRIAGSPGFQEMLTAALASEINAEVTTVGRHMKGAVLTTCKAGYP